MEGLTRLTGIARELLQRVLAIAGNRFELLVVELQEERDRLIVNLLLVLAIAGLGLLALMAVSAALVVLLWPYAPIATLVGLAILYVVVAGLAGLLLRHRLRSARALAATLDQLKKDRAAMSSLKP